jgi:HK97 gp10 family phage protein
VSDLRLEVQGLDTLVRTMRKAGEDLGDLKAANARAGEIVAAAASAMAPRRTGKLAASVRASKQAKRAQVVAGRAAVPYAAPIHWGWPSRHIDPQPFMSQAAQATEPQWLPQYKEDIDKVLDQVTGA